MSFRLGNAGKLYNEILSKILVITWCTGSVLVPFFYLPFTRDVLTLPKEFFLIGLVLFGFLLWLLKIIFVREIHLKKTILDIPLLIFLAVTIISSVVSLSPILSFWGRATDFVLHASVLLAYAGWFWLFVQIVDRESYFDTMITCLLASGVLTGFTFLLVDVGLLTSIATATDGGTVVSSLNSLFGIFIAVLTVLSIGLLLLKDRPLHWQIAPMVMVLVGLFSLFRIGFTLSWGLFALGMAFLLIVSFALLKAIRIWALAIALAVFLVAMAFVFIQVPQTFKADLPVEISLGLPASWDIVSQTFLANLHNFLLGSGPGTFMYDFSQYRSASFNINAVAWSIRFHNPYSSFFALITEFGILGTFSFFAIILLVSGAALSGWVKNRSSLTSMRKSFTNSDNGNVLVGPRQSETFIIFCAWLLMTCAFFVAFFEVTLWWLWWWLLAAVIVSVATLSDRVIQDKRVLLQVSPQYSLLLSFSLVLIVASIVVLGSTMVRMYSAEVAFTKASAETDPSMAEEYLMDAVEYRGRYSPYRISLARTMLQKARDESQKEGVDPTQVAENVASAVNQAKIASDFDKNSIETWETLGIMYINARSFAPEANDWAFDAITRAIELEPTNPLLHWHLGGVHVFDNQLKQAEESYEKAIELKPDYVAAYHQLALVYEQQEDFTKAIEVYQPILPAIQDNVDILFNVGRLLYNRNEGEDDKNAEMLWLRTVELEPGFSNALYSLGLLYERREDMSSALKYFREVKDLNPENTDLDKKIESLLF